MEGAQCRPRVSRGAWDEVRLEGQGAGQEVCTMGLARGNQGWLVALYSKGIAFIHRMSV